MQSSDRNIKMFTSDVTLAVGGAVTAQNGLGVVVARTGVGTYTCTLSKEMYKLVGSSVMVKGSVLESLAAQVTDYDQTDKQAPVVTFKLFNTTTGAAADVANICELLVTLIFKNSSAVI